MAENSGIEWTHHTFNPWWGCVKISPACTHCYAATFANRYGVAWGPKADRRFFGEKHWQEPLKWDRKAAQVGERHRVFCASMADVFELLPEEHPNAEQMGAERYRLWELIRATPNLDWLLLTKRPENVLGMVPGSWASEGFPRNVWVGTTVENQEQAEKRIPELLQVPAKVRFLSCEPLLGPVDLRQWITRLQWVIAGGESGPGARPSHPDWFRDIRDCCRLNGAQFHFKQWGDLYPWEPGRGDKAKMQAVLKASGKSKVAFTPVTLSGPRDAHEEGRMVLFANVGKKVAGRRLDGRTHDGFPEVAG